MSINRTEPLVATYLHAKGAKLGIPVSGTFELTARCNFNCPMCYVHNEESARNQMKSELPAQWWISLARNACDEGMMFALLTGGEPLIRDDFFEIYEEMKKMGLMLSINSNGSLIKGEVLNRLIDNPPFRMNISLYGGNKKTYINMCSNDAFDDVMQGIIKLKEAGVDVRLNLSLTPYNKDDINTILDIAKKLNIHIKFNSYMYPPHRIESERFNKESRFTPLDAARYTTIWDKLRMDDSTFLLRCNNILAMQSDIQQGCVSDADKEVLCRAGRSSFWVSWDGKLLPCGMMKEPCVNLLESDFTGGWKKIREASAGLTLPSKCITCNKRRLCNICPAICVTETGSCQQVPDYMCEYTDALIDFAGKYVKKG